MGHRLLLLGAWQIILASNCRERLAHWLDPSLGHISQPFHRRDGLFPVVMLLSFVFRIFLLS